MVETENGNLYDDSRYPFDVVNENGETSNAMIEQWSLIDASTQGNAAFTFSATLSGVLDGIPLRYPNSDSTRLLSNIYHGLRRVMVELVIRYSLAMSWIWVAIVIS